MLSHFSPKSAVFAALALGTLISCGGSGSNSGKNEIPYILPVGTKITIVTGSPQGGTRTDAVGNVTNLTPQDLETINWTTRQFTFLVVADGIAQWQIWGIATGSQFAFSRTSPTAFDMSVSWTGGSMRFSNCELPSISSTYGTIGRWECWQTQNLAIQNIAALYLFGGGTAQDQLMYERPSIN